MAHDTEYLFRTIPSQKTFDKFEKLTVKFNQRHD